MHLTLYIVTIFLFCLLHLPSFYVLHSYHQVYLSYKSYYIYAGLALYLITFMILSSIVADFLRLIIPTKYFFLLWCLPAGLLFTHPNHLSTIKQTGFCPLEISHTFITSTVTFFLAHCGEATALLLLLSLYTKQDIPLYLTVWLGIFFTAMVSRLPCSSYFIQSRFFFFLQYLCYLLITILFLYVYPVTG